MTTSERLRFASGDGSTPVVDPETRIGVVGATGAVGRVVVRLLRERGYSNLRTFASSRSAGSTLDGLTVEEATPDSLARDDLDVCLFSVGAAASMQLVPVAAEAGAVCVDKSSAFRLTENVPLVVPEVNGAAALEHSGILANPNCCAIPLAMVLAPLHEAAGLRRVRVATYQSASGAGARAMEELRNQSPEDHALRLDWDLDGAEFDEEVKLREETRKILDLPDLPVSASCVRVPVLVGHAETVWVETESRLDAEAAEHLLAAAPGLEVEALPRPERAVGVDDVLVGRVRPDTTVENGLVLFLVCDNLRKGAALNAIQIAELAIAARAPA